MSGLRIDRLSYTAGARLIVDGVDITAPEGAITAVLGPNGAGKSTLLRLIAGVLAAQDGTIAYDGAELRRLSRRERARRIALVEQEWTEADGLTVREIVELGRIPHQSWLATASTEDEGIVEESLRRTGADVFADREASTLSGGERQRANLARALAQQPQLLLCDEPTNHLDVHAQLSSLRLLRDLAADGLTIVAALHDLNHAARFSDHVVVLEGGVVRAAGSPSEVLTPECVQAVWRVTAEIVEHAGRPLIVFGEPVDAPSVS
ncbi:MULTISPECIES: ABC transporter ATP-binding protein [unclassified Microbacterium]|uniref:ABC transporter ATP-binding protein n=1 Tax=unclassified Microbacterium TaxID=2609290 RepID=UPI0012FA80E6|nr:ATP-binding cassette domain-containing protein [Microbacterium sp. MAH-37]MVQ43997.1 ATP-binding cassette domain-containing protein [Microbacterium sp. MAH-37]